MESLLMIRESMLYQQREFDWDALLVHMRAMCRCSKTVGFIVCLQALVVLSISAFYYKAEDSVKSGVPAYVNFDVCL